jgi:hypothetical protein
MPTVVPCPGCGKKLKFSDSTTATKGRCPACGEVISLARPAVTPKPPVTQPEADEEPHPRPAARGVRKGLPDDAKPRSRPTLQGIEEVEPVDEEDRPRKKKRRRRAKAKKPAPDIPWWVWAWFAGVFLLFAGMVSAAAIHSGHGALVLLVVIGIAISLPVSVVILVISMFAASALLGGIDFGEAHVAIPKAAALLFVVSLLSVIPCVGPLLTLPVWLFGLMKLFALDFTEARTLVIINWGFNTLFKYFVLGAILSSLAHRGPGEGPRPIKVPSGEAAAVKKIEALGGTCEPDDAEGEGHIVEVTLEGRPVDDASLALLRSFPKLRSLDLAQTRITDRGLRDLATLSSLEHLDLSGDPGVTDAGLDHLAALPRLQMLVLTGTRVTERGVQKLRAARPGLEVVR